MDGRYGVGDRRCSHLLEQWCVDLGLFLGYWCAFCCTFSAINMTCMDSLFFHINILKIHCYNNILKIYSNIPTKNTKNKPMTQTSFLPLFSSPPLYSSASSPCFPSIFGHLVSFFSAIPPSFNPFRKLMGVLECYYRCGFNFLDKLCLNRAKNIFAKQLINLTRDYSY